MADRLPDPADDSPEFFEGTLADGLDDSPFLGPDRDPAPLGYPLAIDEGAR